MKQLKQYNGRRIPKERRQRKYSSEDKENKIGQECLMHGYENQEQV